MEKLGRVPDQPESAVFWGEPAGCPYCLDLGIQYIKVYSKLYERDIEVVRPCPHCAYGEAKERAFLKWREEESRPKLPDHLRDRERNVFVDALKEP